MFKHLNMKIDHISDIIRFYSIALGHNNPTTVSQFLMHSIYVEAWYYAQLWNHETAKNAAYFIHQYMHNGEIDHNNINTLDIADNQVIHNNEHNIEMHPSIFDCNLDDFRRTCTSLFHHDWQIKSRDFSTYQYELTQATENIVGDDKGKATDDELLKLEDPHSMDHEFMQLHWKNAFIKKKWWII